MPFFLTPLPPLFPTLIQKTQISEFKNSNPRQEAYMGSCFLEHLKAQPFWVLVLFILGSFSILKFSLSFNVFASISSDLSRISKSTDLGHSSPNPRIGKAFAFQLARKGLNLILVGQNPDKLKDVSDVVLAKYGKTQIKIVVVDFTGDLDNGVRCIWETIEGLDVDF